MVAEWIASAIKTIYTVVNVAATVGTGAVCPPCAPLVGGAFAVGGIGLDMALKGDPSAEHQPRSEYQLVVDDLEYVIDSLEGVNGTVWKNQQMLQGIDRTVMENRELLQGIKGTVWENQGMLTGINRTIFQNQAMLNMINGTVLRNHEMLVNIRAIINRNAEENRQMLNDIKSTMKTFEENMNRNINELKVFMIEKDFTQNTEKPLRLLWRFMEAAIESPTKASIDRFISKYKSNSPRNILAELIIDLDFTHANPIVAAMEHNVLNSRKILDDYMHLMSHIIFKVMALEGFYFGVSDLPKTGTTAFFDALSKEVDYAMRSFRTFVSSYKMPKEKYWPAAVEGVMIEKNVVNMIMETIEDAIADKIGGIYTTDVFSIYVVHYFNHYDPIPFELQPDPNVLMYKRISNIYLDTYDVYAVVIRSEKYHQIDSEKIELVRASFKSYAMTKRLTGTSGLTSIRTRDPFFEIVNDILERKLITGFTAVNMTDTAVRFTNNGSAILTNADLALIPTYYGLSWV